MMGWRLLFLILALSINACLIQGTDDETKESHDTNTITTAPAAAQMSQNDETTTFRRLDAARYIQLRKLGVDEVSNTREAQQMREYRLRSIKTKGIFKKRYAKLDSTLYSFSHPTEYEQDQAMIPYTDSVASRKTLIPFKFYDLPICPKPELKTKRIRKSLGYRLQGHDIKPSPFLMNAKQDKGCTPLCVVTIHGEQLRWLRKLVERQYRVQLTLDDLPVMMRSKELNCAIPGFLVGFIGPPAFTGLVRDEYFIYNHLKFSITYQEDPSSFNGIRITGFDVHPVSIQHNVSSIGTLDSNTQISTCNAEGASEVVNNPSTYMPLHGQRNNDATVQVLYSYEVQWVQSTLSWSDRWDVYLLGSIHDINKTQLAIVNSLMMVLFLTMFSVIIIIRSCRKSISSSKKITTVDEGTEGNDVEQTGWKALHGDVFRPPSVSPVLLCVLVGTGAQVGIAFFLTVGIAQPLKIGHTLEGFVLLYSLCGCVGGYVSARLCKLCITDVEASKQSIVYTAFSLSGLFWLVYCILDLLLYTVGAATAVYISTIFVLFVLLVLSVALVLIGTHIGQSIDKMKVLTETNDIARGIPKSRVHPLIPVMLGGILPFASVTCDLPFLMRAVWLDRIYYDMVHLSTVSMLVTITCVEVSMIMCFFQLSHEDHRWWWKSFWNCGSAGGYLFLYSVWMLLSEMDLVGILSPVIYLTYMGMISILFGLFCGCVGFLASLCFVKALYRAKVE